jgi:PKD repeat protein
MGILYRFAGTLAQPQDVVTSYTASVTNGPAPLTVTFTDTTTNNPTAWFWDFGDGQTSDLQNPVHTFTAPGTYNINLNAVNVTGNAMMASGTVVAN